MDTFRNRLLSVINSSARQAKNFVNSVADTFNNFDLESQLAYLADKRDSLIEKGNSLLNELGEFVKDVKDGLNDFSVTVPFDESIGEELSYTIKDNELKVTCTYHDDNSSRNNEVTVKIPDNCDVLKATKTVNSLAKTATITIPKAIVRTEGNTQKKKVQGKKKYFAQKPKVKRGPNGRFVRTEE